MYYCDRCPKSDCTGCRYEKEVGNRDEQRQAIMKEILDEIAPFISDEGTEARASEERVRANHMRRCEVHDLEDLKVMLIRCRESNERLRERAAKAKAMAEAKVKARSKKARSA
jgi:hypothetical protein